MGSEQADPFVNRDTPIPVVSVTGPDHHSAAASGVQTPSNNNGALHRLSPSRLKDKLDSLGSGESPGRVSDRIFTMLLSSVLPSEDLDDDQNGSPHVQVKDRRSRSYVDRPNFSLPVMSSNFRRFNSRIGVAFVAQNRAIRLFTWRTPTHTLSFLFVYTFVCIDPTLLAVLPLACCVFFIMVPAYLARHPPPPTHLPTDLYPLDGPPLAAARTVKPAPELSKDFFRNMRDLQNVMEDFSRGHDAVIAFLTPLTNFSNEALSSLIYIILIFTSCSLFIFSDLIPWRFVFLLAGYTLTALGHPAIQDLLAPPPQSSSSSTTTSPSDFLSAQNDALRSQLLTLSQTDITLTTSPETRSVEIFELQHRPLHSPQTAEYEPYLFSPSTYAPMSPSRIAGDRPKGCPFFEDVQPPRGWRWADKKWTLDLLSREWVEERCVTGVEVEIEGERWVTDLVYDDLVDDSTDADSSERGLSTASSQDEKEVLRRAWEVGRPSRMGEWRRRRWVRAVERVPSY
ncbi:Pex24p-domain-containing protein [Periconia macrospinosa]|uniref:Pex24p-domain-containing protein n=1 Tax=Periconia macrospinosa TaxID=97972 RepID=A0A2V1DFU8_9PLEO|nr:Pex24p-domain-containing protein [Periconia macrospinosa]